MIISKEDLLLIGGNFISAEVPKEYAWLLRYFVERPIVERFLVYYIIFSDLRKRISQQRFCDLFVDHTGYLLSNKALCAIMLKIDRALKAEAEALRTKNLEMLSAVRNGKYLVGFWIRKGHRHRRNETDTDYRLKKYRKNRE